MNFIWHIKLISTLLISFQISVEAQAILDQPVIKYDFNNNLNDQQGLTSTSSLVGNYSFSTYDCPELTSINLDGGNLIELNNSENINYNNEFTIFVKVRIPELQNTLTSTVNAIVSKWILDSGHHDRAGFPFGIRVFNQTSSPDLQGKIIFLISDGLDCGNASRIISDKNYNDDQFHSIIAMRADNEIHLYIDCEYIGSLSTNNLICNVTNDAKIILGARNETFAFFRPNNFTGEIDEFQLFDKAISDESISTLCSFNDTVSETITYSGCEGDNYSITINGNEYNEQNPTGQELVNNPESGCDTLFNLSLEFLSNSVSEVLYNGCTEDDYSITINGTVYNELNPFGTETVTASNGCDSLISIMLSYDDYFESDLYYGGCQGDDYSIMVNGNTYNELNPFGTELLVSSNSACDTLLNIFLEFNEPTFGEIVYNGCENDGYQLDFDGVIFNESNPEGIVIITNHIGCDSIISVELNFVPMLEEFESYEICDSENLNIYDLIITGPGNYTSIIQDNNTNCPVTKNIEVVESPCLYVPNIISLNSVNNNLFEIGVSSNIEILDLKIFDRWGNIVFDSNFNQTFIWDGFINNTKASEGVYTALIKYTNNNGTPISIINDFVLLR